MSYVLRRNPVWMESLPLGDSAGTISILGEDDYQVNLPAALLLAVSPLVREIFMDQVPPAFSSSTMSLPDISGEVATNFGEFLVTGKYSSDDKLKIHEFQHLLDMLRMDCNLVVFDIIEDVEVFNREDAESGGNRSPSVNHGIADAEELESIDNEYYEMDIKVEAKTIKEEDNNESTKETHGNIINKETDSEGAKSPTHRRTSTESIRSLNKKCENCGKVFTTNSTLARHIDSIHGTPSLFSCKLCTKMFKRSDTLGIHMKVDHKKMVLKCSICGKGFKHRQTLAMHKREHTTTNLLACNVCGKQFIRADHLSRHALVHQVISERKKHEVACNVCGKKYSRKDCLIRHIRIVHEEKRFQCSLCKKEYKTKDSRKEHMKKIHDLHLP